MSHRCVAGPAWAVLVRCSDASEMLCEMPSLMIGEMPSLMKLCEMPSLMIAMSPDCERRHIHSERFALTPTA